MKNEEQDLNDKLLRLHNSLAAIERDKKIAVAGYKDQIGDIKDEIKETITALNEIKGGSFKDV